MVTPEVIAPIARRRSSRAFADAALPREVLAALVAAAACAPSSRGEQPWRMLVTQRGGPGFAALAGCLAPFNARWATAAASLTLVVARRAFTDGGANAHAWYDAGAAVGMLVTQATALGVVARQMAGFDAAATRVACALPDDVDPVVIVALGWPADAATLPDDVRARELALRRTRPIGELASLERWDAPFASAD